MKVKAIKRGFAGGQLRSKGDIFEFSGELGSWMTEVKQKAKPKRKAKPKDKKTK